MHSPFKINGAFVKWQKLFYLYLRVYSFWDNRRNKHPNKDINQLQTDQNLDRKYAVLCKPNSCMLILQQLCLQLPNGIAREFHTAYEARGNHLHL